jgi:glycosyltransferase involved in cell wall biosynthesis
MRIVQVVNVRWFNATAWYGLELARAGQAAGHPSLAVCLPDSEPLAQAQKQSLPVAVLPLNTLSPLRLPGLFLGMRDLVRGFAPDVVNCHRGESFPLWAMLRQTLPRDERFALVRTRGDQRLPRADCINRRLHAHAADAVIATNSRMACHFAARMGVPADRLHLVPGGVDTARFAFNPAAREQIRASLGYDPRHVVIGLLGRFDRVKGQKECIAAAGRLIRRGLPVRLLLIGFSTATSREEVETWIRQAGFGSGGNEIAITGRIGDPAAYISAIDVGVISSLWSETIARAALEIMACGRALISTDVGVMPDLLPPEALCPPGDVSALSALLERAVTDAAWRERLRALNRTVIGAMDSRDFFARTLAVYRQAAARADACRRGKPAQGDPA